MLRKFFIIYYKIFKNEENKKTAYDAASMLQAGSILSFLLVIWLLVLLVLIDKMFHLKIYSIKGFRYYYIVGYILILVIIIRYFTLNRIWEIEEEFSKLSPEKQNFFKVLSGILIVLPILTIVTLLTK